SLVRSLDGFKLVVCRSRVNCLPQYEQAILYTSRGLRYRLDDEAWVAAARIPPVLSKYILSPYSPALESSISCLGSNFSGKFSIAVIFQFTKHFVPGPLLPPVRS